MRHTKKLTLSALSVAFGVLLLYLGTLLSVLDLTAVALAALLVVFAQIELHSPYQFFVAAGTALLAFLLLPDKTPALLYLLFGGIYPIVKGYLERLPRILAVILKIAVYNLFLGLSLWALFALFGFDPAMYSFGGKLPLLAVYIIGGIFLELLLFLYDLALTRLRLYYLYRLRQKILPILK